MNSKLLAQGISHPKPAMRLNVIRVIGMVEETQLLEAIRQQHQQETDSAVKAALEWAGKRLFKAHKNGHSTLEAIFDHFNINHEIAHLPESDEEAELMRQMEANMTSEMMRRQAKAQEKKLGLSAGAALGGVVAGAAMGGIIGGAMATSAVSGGLSVGAEVASSNIGGEQREHISRERIPPPMPSDRDVAIWIKRLREGANAEQRKTAARELGTMRNTIALPHLAVAFTSDPDPEVRQLAEYSGKKLYWGAVYYEMSQDGSFEKEYMQRVEARRKAITAGDVPATPQPSTAPSPAKKHPTEEDIGAILARVKAKRGKKQKKRRR